MGNATVSGGGWNIDSSTGVTFYTFQGAGGATAIQAALDALIIRPNQDYNENHDMAKGDTDTPAAFDEGPLTFTTTLTTYTPNGFKDVVSLDYVGNVEPVTDEIDIQEVLSFVDEDGAVSVDALEDGIYSIDIPIISVDTPYLTVTGTTVAVKNISPDNIGVIVADGSNESVNGKISWDGGTSWHSFDKGESVDVPYTDINSLILKLDQDIAGDVKIEYSAEVLEQGAANTIISTDTVEFTVHPIADGLAGTSGVKILGNEDEFMELTDSAGNPFSSLSSQDQTEEISSLVLEGVPIGYLVYIGDVGSEVLANNLGDDGSGNNSWTIDVRGSIPHIWLKAPEDIGGVSSVAQTNWDLLDTIKLTTGVTDMGEQIFSSVPVILQINAVADVVEISPQDIKGVEGENINFIFNPIVKDTDASEELRITLHGVGPYAIFKLAGVELGSGSVVYDSVGDIYTIATPSITYSSVDRLSVIQNDFSGTITVGVSSEEKSNGDISAEVKDTFSITITQESETAGDDIMLFDLKGTDTKGGEDTLVFGRDWNSTGIDFTLLDDALTKNVETLDLTKHGNHSITLNITDVEAMTDIRNALTIESDTGDTIVLQNNPVNIDDVWAKEDGTSVYTSTNGTTLTINGGGTVDSSVLSPTASDDVLGYNDTTVNTGAGDDRLIIFDGVEVDFTKVSNVETIDFEVTGNHTISDLTLAQVIAVTDANNSLKIFGDALDNVDFDVNDNWVKNDATNPHGGSTVSEDGKTFDVYTSTNDLSVEVKVQVDITDAI